MPTLDIFDDPAFGVTSLTAAINEHVEGQEIPNDPFTDLFRPGEEGITTTSIVIESEGDLVRLIEAKDRGAPGQVVTGTKRTLRAVAAVHLPTTAAIMADEVQGVRAFGSMTEVASIQSLVSKRLAAMRKSIDATLFWHRLGAIKGQVLDADAQTVLLDLHKWMEVEKQVHAIKLGAAGTDVRQAVVDAKRKSETVLGTSMIQGYRTICGRNFFDKLVAHQKVVASYERWQDGAFARGDQRKGFMFADVEWREFYGKVGPVEFIDPDKAYLVPVGVQGLFLTRFCPANYMETVNTLGLPYYAKQERMKFDKGIDMEGQSNPITLCTKPRAIIELTL